MAGSPYFRVYREPAQAPSRRYWSGTRSADARFSCKPQSGFARLAHGHTTILMDTGQPAAPGTSRSAAASPLALELCDGAHRIVVNCGKRPLCDPDWQQAARLTSAHSTICLDETNTGRLYGASLVQKLFGNAALLSRGKVEADVTADTSGSIISAQHSCYDMTFGLTCQRSVFLSADGYDLRGEDRLVSSNAEAVANMDPPSRSGSIFTLQ
jgi:uncharacterized heparinase superfamily protein